MNQKELVSLFYRAVAANPPGPYYTNEERKEKGIPFPKYNPPIDEDTWLLKQAVEESSKELGQTMKEEFKKRFIDPGKMAERKEVTDARIEGWIKGQKTGFNRGLAWGVGSMVLLVALVRTIGMVAG